MFTEQMNSFYTVKPDLISMFMETLKVIELGKFDLDTYRLWFRLFREI